MTDRVLVTGISGFLGGHIARELLNRGFTVRGSLRDMARADEVRASLGEAGVDASRLEVCKLDLTRDEGWAEAVRDCRFVQHVASPFVLAMPKDENELIVPAVEGTRRVVTSALDAGAERIVVTSSIVAVDSGYTSHDRVFDSTDWTDMDGPLVSAYAKSKTLAEREAWAIAERAGARDRLAVINPGTVLGPFTSDDPGTSAVIIQRMLRGDMPMLPNLNLPYVDVRDVVDAHVAAMTSDKAAGQRTLVTNAATPLVDIAATLRDRLGDRAAKVPKRGMPGWMSAIVAMFDPALRGARTYLGVRHRYSVAGAQALLGRDLLPVPDALEATARSLIERRLV